MKIERSSRVGADLIQAVPEAVKRIQDAQAAMILVQIDPSIQYYWVKAPKEFWNFYLESNGGYKPQQILNYSYQKIKYLFNLSLLIKPNLDQEEKIIYSNYKY